MTYLRSVQARNRRRHAPRQTPPCDRTKGYEGPNVTAMKAPRLFFRMTYLLGWKPWDSGMPPPELVEWVEGSRALPPGRALDIGCGTGTNARYLLDHKWQVTGVDFVPRAVQ